MSEVNLFLSALFYGVTLLKIGNALSMYVDDQVQIVYASIFQV